MAGSESNANNEFVELYNPTASVVDLTGWSIKRKSSSGSENSLLVATRLQGKTAQPGKHFLATNETGYSGSVAPDVSWATSNTLAYTNNSVILYDAQGAKVEEVSWTEIPKGQSYARVSWDSSQFSVQATPTPQNTSAP